MSRAESQARTRRLLLDRAREVFAEHGYHRAAVEDIAARAGFTRGAFYANFEDKADALLTLWEADVVASFEELRRRLEEVGPAGAIDAATGWFEAISGGQPLRQALEELVGASVSHGDAVRERLAALDRQVLEVCAEAIRAGAGDNTLPLPVEDFALMAYAIGSGVERVRALNPQLVRPGLFLDVLVYLWTGIAALGGDPTDPPATPPRRRRVRAG